MTSPAHRFGTLRSLTREQCIAALLVGAVVVLLGFASGLGIAPTGTAQPAALPSVSTTGGAQSPTASTSTAAPPIAYVVEPVPPAVGAAGSVAASLPTGTTTVPTSSTPTPAPSTSSAPAAPTCSPDVLTTLLSALLPGQLLTDLGLPSLGELLGSLDGLTAQVTGLLSLDRAGLLQAVTAQLPASAPAASCTDAVSDALPLIADGATISSAVTSVEAAHK